MSVRRGQVVVIDWPFSSGAEQEATGLVVQNDRDNARVSHTIVAMIASVRHRALEPTQLLIEVSASDGAASGLHRDWVVNCLNLFTVEQAKVVRTLGQLSAARMRQVNECLKAALELP